jgi:hypothetical protein
MYIAILCSRFFFERVPAAVDGDKAKMGVAMAPIDAYVRPLLALHLCSCSTHIRCRPGRYHGQRWGADLPNAVRMQPSQSRTLGIRRDKRWQRKVYRRGKAV